MQTLLSSSWMNQPQAQNPVSLPRVFGAFLGLLNESTSMASRCIVGPLWSGSESGPLRSKDGWKGGVRDGVKD